MSPAQLFADLIRRRPGAARWPYVAPVLVGLLFVGHAYEDDGVTGAAIYGGFIAFCAVQALWPTVLAWVLLFGLFLGFGLAVAISTTRDPPDERLVFALLGLGPALLLWLGRPWRKGGSKWLAKQSSLGAARGLPPRGGADAHSADGEVE